MPGTQANQVAKYGSEDTSDCIKNCKNKKLIRPGTTSLGSMVHKIKSAHKGAPSHHTPHNKAGRLRKNPGESAAPPSSKYLIIHH